MNLLKLLGVSLLFFVGCSESDDNKSETSEIALLGTQDTFAKATASLSSAGALIIPSTSLNLDSEVQHATDTKCSNYGRAWDPTTSQVKGAGDDDFAVDSFRCMMTVDSTTDTPIGFVQQWAFIFCALEEANGSAFEYSTTAATASVSINPSNASAACKALTTSSIIDQDETFNISVSTQDISASNLYDKKLILDMSSQVITVRFATSATKLAIGVTESSDERVSSVAVTIDQATGVLNFESARYKSEASDLTEHRRVKVSGTIDSDLTFSALTSIQGIDAVCHDAGCTEGDGFTAATINGTIPSGLAYSDHWYQSSQETKCAYGNQASEAACISDGAGCSGASCSAEHIAFMTDLSTQTNPFFAASTFYTSYMNSDDIGPLCFDSVTHATLPTMAKLASCTLTAD